RHQQKRPVQVLRTRGGGGAEDHQRGEEALQWKLRARVRPRSSSAASGSSSTSSHSAVEISSISSRVSSPSSAGWQATCVKERSVAALAAEKSFAGRSQLRTWLTGILKHKIIDAIRRSSREQLLADDSLEDLDALFDQSGPWREAPQDWPEQALESKQFLEALEKCLAALPARTSQVFLMREHLGLATAEICKELGITATHCWVLLYRSRM